MSTDNVQFEKKAALLKQLGKYLASGVGTAAAWDVLENAPKEHESLAEWLPFVKTYKSGDKAQMVSDALSFTSGLLAAPHMRKNKFGKINKSDLRGLINFTTVLPLVKGVGFAGRDYLQSGADLNRANLDFVNKQINALSAPKKVDVMSTDVTPKDDRFNYILAALGTGALGLGGLAVAKYLADKKEKQQASIKYRVQGRKGDPFSDAIVDMPIRVPRLSPKAKEGLEAGLRRQVNKQVKYLSMKRDPNTGKMIPYEDWNRLYGQEDLDASTRNPDENYATGLDNKYEKSAATREWAEGAGSMLQWLLGSAAGAYLGDKLLGDEGVLPGKFVGAAVGGLGPGVLGAALGSIAGKYTPKEQVEHDSEHSIAEFAVPGYADYHSARRNPLVNIPTDSIEEEGEYDDDFDKEAAGPPSGQPASQHTNTDMKTVRAVDGPPPLEAGAPAESLPTNPGASMAMNAINAICGHYGIQPRPGEQQMV